MRKWTILIIALFLVMPACGVAAGQSNAYSRHPVDSARIEKAPLPGLITTNMAVAGVNNNTLAARIVGAGISYSNASFRGVNRSAGFFMNGSGIIGISDGVILSSGNIANVKGPNMFNDISANNSLKGDADLDTLIPGSSTYDATVLAFDFKSTGNVIRIQYVFSSDEYNEFVGSEFNDVFGFFVNGKNIAKLPDSTNVTINTINSRVHPGYFRNNSIRSTQPLGPINTEMDGLTTVVTSLVSVTPNRLNKMKIAIADTGDSLYDSNVFIKIDSLSTYTGPVIYSVLPASGNVGAVEKLVRITGDNFNKSANVTISRGPRVLTVTNNTYISRTRMDFNVTIPWTSPAGTWNLTVKNSDSKVYHATDIYTVKNPVPSIVTISPSFRVHGGTGFTLNIYGNNFVPSSRVWWNNAVRKTTYLSRTRVSANVSAADILAPGSVNVRVNNTAPGGGWSNTRTFTIT